MDLSIPAQLGIMREHARHNGWNVVAHFVDEGESARTADRPELKRLIQHCREHKDVDIVLVHKLDRLARNLVDYATIKAILKQKGIRLVSVAEPFDDNPVGRLLENIIASISEWYSANLGEEIKKASAMKLQKGEWPGKPPVGYRSARDSDGRAQHAPDPRSAPWVRQAFALYVSGEYSLQALAEEMSARGLKTRKGHPYSRQLMKALLRRSFYIGKLQWRGREYPGKHKPLITPELYYRVQERLKARSADTGVKGSREFLLRGFAYCQACGRRMTAETHPRGSYYRCLPVHGQTCAQPYAPVRLLDEQLDALYERLQPPRQLLELLRSEMEQIAQTRKRLADEELGALHKTLDELERKQLKLLDELLAETVSREVYGKMEQRLAAKKREAEARLSQLDVNYQDPLDFFDKCIVVASALSFLHRRLTFEQRHSLLGAVFERLEVRDRTLVAARLRPPFALFLQEDADHVFETVLSGGRNRTILEQLASLTLSAGYSELQERIAALAEQAASIAKNGASAVAHARPAAMRP